MKLIVITSAGKHKSEIESVISLFESGLQILHLRKPGFSTRKLSDYISKIPVKYHDRIIVHGHHRLAAKYSLKGIHLSKKHRQKKFRTWLRIKWLKMKKPDLAITTSFHSLLSMIEDEKEYAHVFLSPVFDSISKKGYGAAFSYDNLGATLRKISHKVIALGGVKVEHVPKIKELGFDGLALLGSIWDSGQDEVEVFEEIQDLCKNPKTTPKQIEITPVKIQL